MRIRRYVFCLLLLTLLVTGCGNRGIPVIKQELLDKKMSVLMLTSAGISDNAKQSVGSALQQWRDSNLIAFDWIKDVTALDDAVVTKLKARTYDYIYVIGNELLPAAEQVIQQGATASKWTLLQSQLDASGQTSGVAGQAAIIQIDPSQVESLKNKWVNDLLAQKSSVEWITRADHPIPSAWAPSEEADHIVLLDNNDQWFQQLAFQTRQHLSNWIIFYAPTDAAHVQKAKSIGVSVMDLNGALSAELNWSTILNNRLQAMQHNAWKPGVTFYNDQELKELKMN
ncbi:hypothetical protein [Paenibacillus sedimenti]|uniref:Uncharacterized protein n=1 Tax=Paenibacillus sedimenti TaxID=2770274 RepID=A0A926QJA1_9BACL|nr:hypothetical protein [Paenibacillus sedimenti]MBD0380289.1 hypothetical protein [Paenibacillus sedimenti]